MKKITSQKEADEVRTNLAKQVSNTLGIPIRQAYKRIDAFNSVQEVFLLKYGIESPLEEIYQFITDIAMQIPQLEK